MRHPSIPFINLRLCRSGSFHNRFYDFLGYANRTILDQIIEQTKKDILLFHCSSLQGSFVGQIGELSGSVSADGVFEKWW
jgi:hypothetical protein